MWHSSHHNSGHGNTECFDPGRDRCDDNWGGHGHHGGFGGGWGDPDCHDGGRWVSWGNDPGCHDGGFGGGWGGGCQDGGRGLISLDHCFTVCH